MTTILVLLIILAIYFITLFYFLFIHEYNKKLNKTHTDNKIAILNRMDKLDFSKYFSSFEFENDLHFYAADGEYAKPPTELLAYNDNGDIININGNGFSGEVHKSTIEGTNDLMDKWNRKSIDELKGFLEYCISKNDKATAEIIKLRINYLESKEKEKLIEQNKKESNSEYLRTLNLKQLNNLLQKYIDMEDYEMCELIQKVINEKNIKL